ncbi:hypothetical protein A3A67_03995 [Candidatus Peribacteria bacterium RIFCSPLOWO2_01_FULL_51_18]|nr:MAG: hypothetical protein A3C52_05435 [Candidatus Peribacteria bacterium RIFCSPHIGHO2_02_FULL_51_15]OGJ66786.1 MAG: hypothetical protein A3A67_03995 [Candidatus Peribacteria bacterium RIFCSPLOWO2_01_FULL_51_18]HLD71891.1 SWIM zinc finger family protein [Candidatus Peribacteraceae bacterium]
MPTLATFDDELNETIVKRGQRYFKGGHVRDLEEIDDGRWRALVEGTEVYETTVTISGGAISHHRCNCPYDFGQYCKHEIAVLYAIRERTSGDAGIGKERQSKGGKPQKKGRTVREQAEEAAQKLSVEELRHLVIEGAMEDQSFRSRLLRSAPPPENATSGDRKQEYIDEIRGCMEDNAGRHGFIGWEEAFTASRGASELCATAEQYLESGKLAEALPIGQALLEAIYPDLGRMDDSNGEFGGCIEEGWSILRTIAAKVKREDPLGEELFRYCLEQAGRKIYDGWGDDDNFFRVALTLVLPGERETSVRDAIDRVLLSPHDPPPRAEAPAHDGMAKFCGEVDDYRRERNLEVGAELTLMLLEAVGKKNEAISFMRGHLQHPDVRLKYIEHLVGIGEYAEAKETAKGGIAIAEKKGHPGTSRKFEEWLVTVADKERDWKAKQAFLERFFFDRYEMEEYRRWKASFADAASWKRAYDAAIRKIKAKHAADALLDIYREEEQWDEFLGCIRAECERLRSTAVPLGDAYDFLLQYEETMMDKFPDAFTELVAASVGDHLVHSTGRATYQEICRLLRRLRKHGYEKEVDAVMKELEVRFKNRRALLQEMKKVG